MLPSGFTSLNQELCSKPDLNVQGTHYMWFLDLPVFKSEIVQQVCKAFLNVAAKLEAHRASRKVSVAFENVSVALSTN